MKQIQDVVASKKYKGIIIATSDGPGAIPALQKAMDAGIKVVILNQVVGEKLTLLTHRFLDSPHPFWLPLRARVNALESSR